MNSAFYEYNNKSAGSGAQFVPIWIPTICWKTRLPKSTKNVFNKKIHHFKIITSTVFIKTSVVFLHKVRHLLPKTK